MAASRSGSGHSWADHVVSAPSLNPDQPFQSNANPSRGLSTVGSSFRMAVSEFSGSPRAGGEWGPMVLKSATLSPFETKALLSPQNLNPQTLDPKTLKP